MTPRLGELFRGRTSFWLTTCLCLCLENDGLILGHFWTRSQDWHAQTQHWLWDAQVQLILAEAQSYLFVGSTRPRNLIVRLPPLPPTLFGESNAVI